MNLKIFEQAREYANNRLERELSPNLVYHTVAHTREEVVPAVEILAGKEGLQGEELYLLLTGAWFHDIGYVEQSTLHEQISARIAGEVLPQFNYSVEEVKQIQRAILATALPQSPANLMEKILTDADLHTLGHENFMQRNGDLRQEFALFGKEYTDEQWYSGQLKFLEGHQYFTASTRSLWNAQKMLNIKELKKILNEQKMKE